MKRMLNSKTEMSDFTCTGCRCQGIERVSGREKREARKERVENNGNRMPFRLRGIYMYSILITVEEFRT